MVKKKAKRRAVPKNVKMISRPKGWIKVKAVKVVGRRVFLKRAKPKGRH